MGTYTPEFTVAYCSTVLNSTLEERNKMLTFVSLDHHHKLLSYNALMASLMELSL